MFHDIASVHHVAADVADEPDPLDGGINGDKGKSENGAGNSR